MNNAAYTVIIPVDEWGRVYFILDSSARPALPVIPQSEPAAEITTTIDSLGLTVTGEPASPVMNAVSAAAGLCLTATLVRVNRPEKLTKTLPPMMLREALKLIQEGMINDLFTVAALLRLQQNGTIKDRIEILYRDQYCAAVHKPAGMLVHRTDADQERENLLAVLRDQLGQRVQPIHRLDKPTSGIVLFSLDDSVTRQFYELFQKREIEKIYLTVVRGFTDPVGTIDCPVKDDEGRMLPAITDYETIASVELPYAVGPYPTARYSLVKVTLQTGRMHQIRKHFSHISHPVIGDSQYGDGRHNRLFREKFNCYRLMLAAAQMGFTHPVTGVPVQIIAPPEFSFSDTAERLGLGDALRKIIDRMKSNAPTA